MGWSDDPQRGFWHWSLPCGSIAGIPVALHWSLLLVAAFEAFGAVRQGLPWWWLPVLLIIPPVSVLLHEFGHAGAARLAGGGCERIVLWALGGAAMCDAPARPWHQFAVAAAGPLVSLVLAAGCMLGVAACGLRPFAGTGEAWDAAGTLAAILAFAASINLWLLLFNLLPCYPLDGGRMARAALWPVVGRRRAVLWTIRLAYACLVAGSIWALWTQNHMLLILAVLLFLAVLSEHRAVAAGYDPEFGDADLVPERTPGLAERWRASRARAAAERAERAAVDEQAELDRLLAKVSEHGLPALTAAERKTLQRISQRERERAGRPG